MQFWRKSVLFYIGGCGYMGLELLWRGWTHGSMFVAGGAAFLLLGQVEQSELPLSLRMPAGAAAITGVELAVGLLVNRQHRIWDYSAQPWNLAGQICLPFCLIWLALSLPGFWLYSFFDGLLPGWRSAPWEENGPLRFFHKKTNIDNLPDVGV